MNGDDEYSKFTRSISKFINRQWSKIRSPGQIRSTKTLDQLLEEEYETLLREIDYLASEQTCLLSYKNDHFFNSRSSEDLAELLNKHSEEVLRTYAKQHDKCCKKESPNNRKDLVNYVTEIIVSRPKCEQKLCSCRTAKEAKQVQDNSVQYEKLKKTQNSAAQHSDGKAKNDSSTKEVQTDDWRHDANCTCGSCPKPPRNASTQGKTFEDAATSYPKTVASKNVLANCTGDAVGTQTHIKLCVPENFATVNEGSGKFSICTAKKDCGCDAYDVKEAVKRGLVLPSSDVCIQTKKVASKNKKSGKKTKNYASTTSADDGNGNSFETSSSEIELKQTSKKKKNKQKDKEKKKGKKKKSSSEESESSNNSQQQRAKPQKEETTKCFGTRKKRQMCDEYCQGITGRQRSAQTLPIGTQDKNESADLYGDVDKKAVQTGTNSEMGIQLSSPPSRDFPRKKKEKGRYISEEEMDAPRGQTHNKKSKAERDQDNKEKLNDSITVCNKCGRQKRDCSTGCRNTIIIPYASGSNRTMPVADAESLRMLIKMQNKDTSRQFDNILAELNHQKGEIRRLNDMYHKMVETFYDSQRSISNSKSHSPKMSACGCSNYSAKKSQETAKACGCAFSNECRTANSNPNLRTGRSVVINNNSNDSNADGQPVRRFGPPNTAVSINMCDTCTVEIASPNNKKNISEAMRENDRHEIDKQRKEQLNETKKAIQNITVRFDGGKGDFEVCKQDSVSTIYKNDRGFSRHNTRSNLSKKEAQESFLNDGVHRQDSVSTIYKNDKKYEKPREKSTRDESLGDSPSFKRTQFNRNNSDINSETDYESNKKSRRTYSSRVLVWLKKSWISIKHKRDECKHRQAGKTEPLFNICQRSAARAASSAWKYMKKKHFFTAR